MFIYNPLFINVSRLLCVAALIVIVVYLLFFKDKQ